ncbi:hypothetical protein CLPU_1c03440 [Gottschalkia purinilytica]|uniref:Uncharacterized protein n=1 Tax=Gottschalkia purinilytica TaxID=1503 RepID=A0A0L0WFD5_GOTPU|nr:hypothetical protein CLPU_1c03440 [Gottschalkia purinilytica]
MYIFKGQIDRGRKIFNIGIFLLVICFLGSIIDLGLTKGINIRFISSAILNIIIILSIFKYFKGSIIAFKIIYFFVSGLAVFLFPAIAILLSSLLLKILNIVLDITNILGGALFIIIPLIIMFIGFFIFSKAEIYDSILAYSNYYKNKNR